MMEAMRMMQGYLMVVETVPLPKMPPCGIYEKITGVCSHTLAHNSFVTLAIQLSFLHGSHSLGWGVISCIYSTKIIINIGSLFNQQVRLKSHDKYHLFSVCNGILFECYTYVINKLIWQFNIFFIRCVYFAKQPSIQCLHIFKVFVVLLNSSLARCSRHKFYFTGLRISDKNRPRETNEQTKIKKKTKLAAKQLCIVSFGKWKRVWIARANEKRWTQF